jgi:diguanylate cyclase (GGDEF)-like protein
MLSRTQARLAVGVSIAAAVARTEARMRSAYLNVGLTAAIIILLAWLAGEVLVLSPLRGLLAATRQLADGNLDARARLHAPSREFRELATSFNAMADRLAGLATCDSLTSVANRRRFEQYLDDEWRRALRAQYPIALALIDIDGFKLFNDRHGHQIGDQCLRIVATELARHARRSEDLLGRYGGEEFVVGLPGLGEAEAYRHCERMRAAIEALDYPDLGLPAGAITVSVGVAVILPIPGATADRLVAMADAALYEAKRVGRNRVALYRSGPVPAAIHVA